MILKKKCDHKQNISYVSLEKQSGKDEMIEYEIQSIFKPNDCLFSKRTDTS